MKRFIGCMVLCLIVTGYASRDLFSASIESFGTQMMRVQERIQDMYPEQEVYFISYMVRETGATEILLETTQFPQHSTSVKKEWIYTPETQSLVEFRPWEQTNFPPLPIKEPVKPLDLKYLMHAPETIIDTVLVELGIDDYRQNPDDYTILTRVRWNPNDPPELHNYPYPLWVVNVRVDKGPYRHTRLWIDAHTGDVVFIEDF